MSLIENIIGQISTQGLAGTSNPINFDLEDDTFSKLFEKQLSAKQENISSNFVGSMGIPAGLVIEPIEGAEFAESVQDQMEILGESKLSKEEYINQPIEFKEIDMGDYFSNLLKTGTENNSTFMNFAKKQATNAYNVFGKNLVDNVADFVNDISSNS